MLTALRRDGAVRLTLIAILSLLAIGITEACSDSAAGRAEGHRDSVDNTVFDNTVFDNTVFGSNVWQAPGEDRRAAITRIDDAYGPIGIARVFSDWLPPKWGLLESDLGRRPLVVSFRVPPSRVLSGTADDRLLAWFRNAPVDRDTYWVYFHEPEDNVEQGDFTAQEFSDAWSHVARLAASVDNPRLRATMILMCWTVNETSGRDWHDYVPASGEVDVLAWDCYAKGADADSYAEPAELLEPARVASSEVGAEWAIAELGARIQPGTGTDRAAWMEEVGDYAGHHGAVFVTWFDAPIGGEFQLTDEPSIRAWARLVRSAPRRRGGHRHRGGKGA